MTVWHISSNGSVEHTDRSSLNHEEVTINHLPRSIAERVAQSSAAGAAAAAARGGRSPSGRLTGGGGGRSMSVTPPNVSRRETSRERPPAALMTPAAAASPPASSVRTVGGRAPASAGALAVQPTAALTARHASTAKARGRSLPPAKPMKF